MDEYMHNGERRNVVRKANENREYSIGMKLYKEKRFGEAIEHLGNHLRKNPNDIKVKFTMAKCYVRIYENDKAKALVEEILDVDEKNSYALIQLGEIKVKEKKYSEAENLFKQVLEIEEKNCYALLALGRLYEEIKRTLEAEKIFGEVQNLPEGKKYAYLELAKLYTNAGRPEKTEEMLDKHVEVNGDYAFRGSYQYELFRLAKLKKELGQVDEAKQILQEIIDDKSASKGKYARFELAKINLEEGQIEEAKKLFEEILDLDDNNSYARTELARLSKAEGDIEGAKRLYRRIIKDDKKQKERNSRFELAKLYREEKNYEEAEALYKEYISMDPQNGMFAHFELGKIYEEQEKYDLARKSFLKVLNLKSNDVYAKFELGKIEAKVGSVVRAEKIFEIILEDDPTNMHVILELANAYEKQGKIRKAEEQFRKIIELDKNKKDIHSRMGLERICIKEGRIEEAKEIWQEAVDIDSDNEYLGEKLKDVRPYDLFKYVYFKKDKRGNVDRYFGLDIFKGYYITEMNDKGISVIERDFEEEKTETNMDNDRDTTYIVPMNIKFDWEQLSRKEIFKVLEDDESVQKVEHDEKYDKEMQRKIDNAQLEFLRQEEAELYGELGRIEESKKVQGAEYNGE